MNIFTLKEIERIIDFLESSSYLYQKESDEKIYKKLIALKDLLKEL